MSARHHVTLIAGLRTSAAPFWTGGVLRKAFPERLTVIYASNGGTFGVKDFVTVSLEEHRKRNAEAKGRKVSEVFAIGAPTRRWLPPSARG